MPIVDVVNDNFENLINNVPEAYRKDAAALPVATDFNLVGTDIRVPGSKPFAQVGNLPWLCHNLWLQYRYSMDETILRNVIFPTLRRAINFTFLSLKRRTRNSTSERDLFSGIRKYQRL